MYPALSLLTDALIVLQADAPEGQVFSKWNDGKADNPRIVTAADASQLFPLFLPKTGQGAVCVKLPVLAGAGMGAVNVNAGGCDRRRICSVETGRFTVI